MKKLNEKEWQPKPVAVMFNKLIPGKGKGLNHLKQAETGINYIGAPNRDNGVLCIVEDDETSSKMVQDGNCIGFIKNGDGSAGYAIYKQEPFISTSDVIYGYADWLDEDTGLFFVVAQDMIEAKYSHGYKRNKQHLRGDKVMLPVTDSGEPDYEYMAGYTKQTREKLLSRYREYVAKRIAELGEEVEIPALSEMAWEKFKAFGDTCILEIATTNSSIDSIRLIEGDEETLPYVTRSESNNGIARFVCEKNKSFGFDRSESITVGLDTQTAYWQPHEFVTGQNIQVITGKHLNEWSAQFLIPLLRMQMKAKFNWGGNGATLKRMKTLDLMLPVADSGEPDYEYMEQYAKNMMLRKYRQYLAYLDRQSKRQE